MLGESVVIRFAQTIKVVVESLRVDSAALVTAGSGSSIMSWLPSVLVALFAVIVTMLIPFFENKKLDKTQVYAEFKDMLGVITEAMVEKDNPNGRGAEDLLQVINHAIMSSLFFVNHFPVTYNFTMLSVAPDILKEEGSYTNRGLWGKVDTLMNDFKDIIGLSLVWKYSRRRKLEQKYWEKLSDAIPQRWENRFTTYLHCQEAMDDLRELKKPKFNKDKDVTASSQPKS